MRTTLTSPGVPRARYFLLLAALAFATPSRADSFEQTAALILGGLKDGAAHQVDPSLVLRRIRAQPLTFSLSDPRTLGNTAVMSVTSAGPCRARLTTQIRDLRSGHQRAGTYLVFDFSRATELEAILARDESGKRIPSVRFAGRSGVCSSRGPGAACAVGQLRHGFRSNLEEVRAAVAEMSRRFCPSTKPVR